MKRQAYQHPELRDATDSIIQDGAFGKKTPLANAEGTGWIDYVANDLEALHDAINGGRVYVANKAALTKPGDVANVYIAEDTGKWYYWNPTTSAYVEIDNARNVANDAIAARDMAKGWAQSTSSPDGAADTASPTGKSQSSKSWALYSKDRATAAASSASSAASSASTASTKATNASTSATAAANSASAASTSASAAKNSQTAAASSASAASSSASTAATHETNAKTALASCQNIQSQVNSGLQALTSAVKYKGSVASYSALPTTGLSTGDMYNVKTAGGTDANGTAIKAGDNLVYNGSGWDDQSGTVDLSNYYTKSEMAGAVMSTTVSNDTITFIHKDATKTTAKVNNVSHATAATSDDKGQAIDIAALKTLITTTVNAGITSALQKVFPVGSIYTSLTDSRNPNAILGFGTWEAIPAGRAIVSAGTATETIDGTTTTYTFEAGKTYGEFAHKLSVDELPIFTTTSHFHTGFNAFCIGNLWNGNGASNTWKNSWNVQSGSTSGYAFNQTIDMDLVSNPVGGDAAHNNLQPSVGAYEWVRTA